MPTRPVAQVQFKLLLFRAEAVHGCDVDATLLAAQPTQHLMPAPTNPPSMKPLFLGKPPEKGQRLKDPSGPACQPGDVMGG